MDIIAQLSQEHSVNAREHKLSCNHKILDVRDYDNGDTEAVQELDNDRGGAVALFSPRLTSSHERAGHRSAVTAPRRRAAFNFT